MIPMRVILLLAGMTALSAGDSENETGTARFLLNLVTRCIREGEFGICVKSEAVRYLDELSKAEEPVALTDYLHLVKNPGNESAPDESAEAKLQQVPRAADERSAELDEMLWRKVKSLIHRRTIQLNIPADAFEGRDDKVGKGDKKGIGQALVAAGMMMAMVTKLVMAKIAFVAGKALITAKIALVLMLILSLKKLSGGGGGGGESGHHSEVVYSSDRGGYGRTDTDDPFSDYAQDLAYRYYKPD